MAYSVRQEDFGSVDGEWEGILPSCATNTIFVTPYWQRIWWRHFGRDFTLCILSVRDGDELLGIAPLMLRNGVISFLGDDDLFDYHDFLVPHGKEEIFYRVLCDYLVGLDWHTMRLTGLPEGSPTLTYLPDLSGSKGVASEITAEETTPVAALPDSWDEYLAGLKKKSRHELRRKLRRLQAADSARQYSCNGRDSLERCMLERCMGEFFRLLKVSSPEKREFLTSSRERFFLDVASELASRGQLQLFFLELDGARVASCICFDYAGSYLLYNSGYDPEYSALSVGFLNKALCVREAIEEGRQSFNFLKGAERYKYDLGGKDLTIYGLTLRR